MSDLVVWFCYANLVALLAGAAGWAAERGLESLGRPVRFAWGASLLLSVLLPAAAFLAGDQLVTVAGLSAVDEAVADGLLALSGGEVTYSAAEGYALAADPAPWITGFWLAATGLALAWLAWSARILGAARQEWEESEGEEGPFYLTPSLGPGVLGVFRQRILLPRWALTLEPDERELIWTHEAEHVRAGDNRLLAGALAVLVAVPWVLPLWWQFRRLELACELDCDRRVLERCGDRKGYGQLLIRVASGSALLPMASFSIGRSSLEHRIRSLARADAGGWGGRTLRAAAAGILLAGLLASAVALPVPAAGANWSLLPVPSESLIPSLEPPLQGYDEHPELLNPSELEEAFRRRYPPELRRRGVEGLVGVLIHIDREGRVDKVRVQAPSPYEALNRLAMDLAGERRYRPAREDGEPVGNWYFIRMEYPPPQ